MEKPSQGYLEKMDVVGKLEIKEVLKIDITTPYIEYTHCFGLSNLIIVYHKIVA